MRTAQTFEAGRAQWRCRAALRLEIREIAKLAEVSPNTITKVEANFPSNQATLRALRRALEDAGIEFIDENGRGRGGRLRKKSLGGSRRAAILAEGTQAASQG